MRFGVLPYYGGLRDQDPQMMADWRVIHDMVEDHKAEQEKKQNKKRGGKG